MNFQIKYILVNSMPVKNVLKKVHKSLKKCKKRY